MRVKGEDWLITDLDDCLYGMFRIAGGLMIDSVRCMRGSDGKLCFSENERCWVWKDYMEMIMVEENDLDQSVEGDAVEGQVVCVQVVRRGHWR